MHVSTHASAGLLSLSLTTSSLPHLSRHACGNFYINDKSTGSIVGQQPFGGARLSGTNDKSGSSLNLLRWTSARSTKEQFLPCDTIAYPSNEPDN